MPKGESRVDELVRRLGELPDHTHINEDWNVIGDVATWFEVTLVSARQFVKKAQQAGLVEVEATRGIGTRSITLTDAGINRLRRPVPRAPQPPDDSSRVDDEDTDSGDSASKSYGNNVETGKPASEATKLKEKIGSQNVTIGLLQKENRDLKQQLGDVPKDVKSGQETITALTSQIAGLEKRHTTLLGSYQAAMQEREDYMEASEHLRGRVTMQQLEIGELKATIERLSRK